MLHLRAIDLPWMASKLNPHDDLGCVQKYAPPFIYFNKMLNLLYVLHIVQNIQQLISINK